jgi:transposase
MDLWHRGLAVKEIAEVVGINERTGYKWQVSLQDHGSIRPKSLAPAGR